jgi:hypothetical protein
VSRRANVPATARRGLLPDQPSCLGASPAAHTAPGAARRTGTVAPVRGDEAVEAFLAKHRDCAGGFALGRPERTDASGRLQNGPFSADGTTPGRMTSVDEDDGRLLVDVIDEERRRRARDTRSGYGGPPGVEDGRQGGLGAGAVAAEVRQRSYRLPGRPEAKATQRGRAGDACQGPSRKQPPRDAPGVLRRLRSAPSEDLRLGVASGGRRGRRSAVFGSRSRARRWLEGRTW